MTDHVITPGAGGRGRAFDGSSLTALRDTVTAYAITHGLAVVRLEDFVPAVSEMPPTQFGMAAAMGHWNCAAANGLSSP